MRKALIVLGMIVILILSGCELLESKQPYIKDISISPDKVSQGEEFKFFVTIKNPTTIEFKPYVSLKYDQKIFRYQYYYNEQDKKILLEPVPSGQEKSYLLKFTAEQDAKTGLTPIGVFLFGEETAKQSLSYQEKQIDIVSNVR